ncbi:hypothetical protein DPMN_126950 [Dreissena polymorpha]|uniref:Uncharacterized protein n=1 Tax=Dreissena polymorpha TaxID=45954 RepID=A0A9D4JW24_DREPO|nr:hypothetical protein DPMN_126950 [Dreissena polymorpha]
MYCRGSLLIFSVASVLIPPPLHKQTPADQTKAGPHEHTTPPRAPNRGVNRD